MSEQEQPWDRLRRIDDGLRKAAGFEDNPCTGLLVTGPISELIHFGYSFEDDILPSIRRQAEALRGKGRETIRSWKCFIPGIIRDRADKVYATSIKRRRRNLLFEELQLAGEAMRESPSDDLLPGMGARCAAAAQRRAGRTSVRPAGRNGCRKEKTEMSREEESLVRATAALIKTMPLDQRGVMLAYVAENVRTTLAQAHATMSSSEIAARVRRHIDAIRERLR